MLAYAKGAESALNEDARKRIEALRACCGVGKGFELAEHDMAIRGVCHSCLLYLLCFVCALTTSLTLHVRLVSSGWYHVR